MFCIEGHDYEQLWQFYFYLPSIYAFYFFSLQFCISVCLCMLSRFSCVWLFATPWTVAQQAPLSMGFPRQEYWRGLPFPPPGNLPNPGIEPVSPVALALAGRFFISWTTLEAPFELARPSKKKEKWIKVVRTDILILFLNSGERINSSTFSNVTCSCSASGWGISSDTNFLTVFIRNEILDFVKRVFCVYWYNPLFLLLYSENMMNYTVWFSGVKSTLHSFINPIWSQCSILFAYCWIIHAQILLRIVMSICIGEGYCSAVSCNIFWFWYQGNAGLVQVRKCPLLFSLLEGFV